MPEINSIPYESAEDLNKYIYDQYQSEQMINFVTGITGYATSTIFELLHETGVSQNSTCMTYYNLPYFNPLYGEAVWKCYMNSMKDCFAFFGFKESIIEPTYDMIESHAGFMIKDGKLYTSVADGYYQQRIEIVGIDATRVQNYKIEYNKFSIQPLPVIEDVLGLPTIYSIPRIWKEMTTLTNSPPKNQVHYVMQFIKNTINANKWIKFNRFIYKEVYAD